MKRTWLLPILIVVVVIAGLLSFGLHHRSSGPEADPDIQQESDEPQQIGFPWTIRGSDLVIESVNRYDGTYLEDGSDIQVAGAASILLTNTGKQAVDYTEIHMTGSKTSYTFAASSLEAGASVLVQEAGKAPAVEQDYLDITADTALTDTLERAEDKLSIEETKDGRLAVTNLTNEDIPCVRVFYKFYQADKQVYLGGITYTAKLTDLKAGETQAVSPAHYTAGESRVVMARTYGSAED